MAQYLVTWRIDIEADTPQDAAREALAIQRDPDSEALYFEVRAEGTNKVWSGFAVPEEDRVFSVSEIEQRSKDDGQAKEVEPSETP